MLTIAVTGAAGFVGRHLVEHLVDAGHDVVAISRAGTGRSDVRNIVVPNYFDTMALATYVAGVDAVIHLAARAHQTGPEPADAAMLYERANVDSAQSMARACRQAGVPRFVLVSSIGVLGNATNGTPFTEADRPQPVEPYAVSKWHAEQAVAAELAAGATDFCVLRPPLVYGEGCKGNFARLLALVARAPVVPLGSVTARRTFIAVDNLVAAMLTVAMHPAASRRSFVVADSESLALGELIHCMARAMGRSSNAVWNIPLWALAAAATASRRRAVLDKLCAELLVDASALCLTTGWVPSMSPGVGIARMAHAHLLLPQAPGKRVLHADVRSE